jgi:DnaJ-class molecular chaperone
MAKQIKKLKFPIKCTCDDGDVSSCCPYDDPRKCDWCNGTGYLTEEKYKKEFGLENGL